MTDVSARAAEPQARTPGDPGRLGRSLRAVTPGLLFGLRLWASVCLALYLAFWLQLDAPHWAATSAAWVCLPQLGASLRKGWYRMIGTLVGAVAIVLLNACFPQDRGTFLFGLALWGAASAFVATLLRNFASYAAALAGYTAAIIASGTLGATGGPDGQVFTLAIARASEICVGIVSAGVVLAGTDFGGARHRLATSLAGLAAETTGRFVRTLALAEPGQAETQAMRRELLRRVIALDPAIDQAIGESATIRYHSPILDAAKDGLFAALAAWRAIAMRLEQLPEGEAQREAETVLQALPTEIRPAPGQDNAAGWTAEPGRLRETVAATVRRLIAMPAGTPSLRILLDQTAKLLAGVTHALEGLALLADDPARRSPPVCRARLGVPDWLPPLVNAGRALVAIGAMELFWISTAWPSGALAVTWTAITAILMAPRSDQAYAGAVDFTVGTALAAASAAIMLFAVLPGHGSFLALGLVLGLYLVPVGALMAQPWRATLLAPMVGSFPPLLAPANQMNYDALPFFNAALAIVVGCGFAALWFRLLPPLSPAFRAGRLLRLTLRDLRRLPKAPDPVVPRDWERRAHGRLSSLPDEAEPVQRAQLLATLSVGLEIIHLRRVGPQLGLGQDLHAALQALASGDAEIAMDLLARLDRRLATAADEATATLRARASVLVMAEALSRHPVFFETGASG